MCTTCGCSDTANLRVTNLQTGRSDKTFHAHSDHSHAHDTHDHGHHHHEHELGSQHDRRHEHETTVHLEQTILAKNDRLAERNRGWFLGRNIVALNLVSSPGSGKTTLLERTIHDLKNAISISVIEGDQ